MRSATFNFNKELVFGECGAFLMANVTASVVARLTSNDSIVSFSAIAGTLLGGGLFWLGMRFYDRVVEEHYRATIITTDILYFTPAAIILGLVVYDPLLYFISHYLLNKGDVVELSVVTGQIAAFIFFLLFMNLYRVVLFRIKGEKL